MKNLSFISQTLTRVFCLISGACISTLIMAQNIKSTPFKEPPAQKANTSSTSHSKTLNATPIEEEKLELEKEEETVPSTNSINNTDTLDAVDKKFLEPEEKSNFPELYVSKDVSYTPEKKSPLQKLDIYYPPNIAEQNINGKQGAPMIVVVHGGAWFSGDKEYKSVVENKVRHYTQKGYIVASVNYRLLPQVSLKEQVRDVNRAISFLKRNDADYGLDARKIIVIGHSSGAHIVALLSVGLDTRVGKQKRPWNASILLDNVAYNVPQIMSSTHPRYMNRAFGLDPKGWETVSPAHHISSAEEGAIPMLLVSITKRKGSETEAKEFAAALESKGALVSGLTVSLDHNEVNTNLGLPSDYTTAVDKYIEEMLKK